MCISRALIGEANIRTQQQSNNIPPRIRLMSSVDDYDDHDDHHPYDDDDLSTNSSIAMDNIPMESLLFKKEEQRHHFHDDLSTFTGSVETLPEDRNHDYDYVDDLPTNYGSVESIFKEQQSRVPHDLHYDDDISTNSGSVESLFEERDHFHDDLSTNFGSTQSLFEERHHFHDDLSTNSGSVDSLLEEQQTTVPHHHHNHHHYDDNLSTNFGSVESIFKEPNDDYADHDYADDMSTDTSSCKSAYTDGDYCDSNNEFYNVMYENSGHVRPKAGVHLPMIDEYFIGEYKNYSSSKKFHKRNSLKHKIYKYIPFLGKFFNRIDAKLESEIRRYLDIKEREKQNYPVRKVKGTRKFLNFLSKNRVFVSLEAFGTLPLLFLVFLLILKFSGSSPLLPLMAIVLVCVGYGLLVFYYVRKLEKVSRLRKHIKELRATKKVATDQTN
ncbi:Uncharacterized protein PCOAH_00002170 [Plasmodium coatneyi]|uniref:Pv-fam-d protein n=1 Tax=Plasmodium coatneyi TaxID=208452 RepID=A0A1B1DTF3_9APIC|nr:Uncharacterized protein PCOAH_00002170 [Plasmodium coatneyi]ANQ05865.1 Uncharacterized protein PCOAH_00002170 [Plasmodium coatneyi]